VLLFTLGGGVLGFTSHISLFPDSDLVIVTLANIFKAVLPPFVGLYFADEVLDLPRTRDWLGKESMERAKENYDDKEATLPPRLKNKPAAHSLEEYEGVYSSPLYAGDVTISLETVVDENGLRKSELHFLFNRFTSKVEHYHFESFLFEWDFWSSKATQLMTFITGENGNVDGLQLPYLDEKISFKKQARVKHDSNGQSVFGWDQAQLTM